MCGIFAYVGSSQDSANICLSGLKALEYRGYDSAGIAGLHKGKIFFKKEVGNISALESSYQRNHIPLDLAIAHTRWATHGNATQENAHPHFDANHTVAVVHNGIIENHFQLRKELESIGIRFHTDTDSEIIAQLIAYYYDGNFVKAFQKALNRIHGLWGIAAIHEKHPDTILVASNECPIAIAFDKENKHAYISSDANAFDADSLDLIFLENKEMAIVSKEGYRVFNKEAQEVMKKLQKYAKNSQNISKNGYEHFMLKEIFEQPHTLEQAMKGRLNREKAEVNFEELTLPPEELVKYKRVIMVACGTSWHAALNAVNVFEELSGIDARAEIASEFRFRSPKSLEDTLVIAISQSGETMDTICAIRELKQKGAKVLGICNVENSTLVRESDSCLFLQAGKEISVASTKAFTSQITVLTLFALYLGKLNGTLKEEAMRSYIDGLIQLPGIVNMVLGKKEQIAQYAKKYAHYKNFFFLGRNLMYVTALESALKLKEISYTNANAYPAGEMKHGPIALIDENLATLAFLGNAKTLDKMLSNLMEVKARKGELLVLAPEGVASLDAITKDIIIMPRLSDLLAPIPYAVAGQLFAYYIALNLGTNIDMPRNLAKSVTVE